MAGTGSLPRTPSRLQFGYAKPRRDRPGYVPRRTGPSLASGTKRRILPWAATESATEPPAPGMRGYGQKARAASSRLRRHRYTEQAPASTADPQQRHLRSRLPHSRSCKRGRLLSRSLAGDLSGVSGGQLGGAVTLMIAPVVVFSLVIAALWAWSLFFHPQTRCARCTGGTPHFGSFLTGSSGLCRKCGGTGWRERPGVRALRTLGWDIGPTGMLRRRGEPAAGTDRGPRLGPQSANPGGGPGSFPGRLMRGASTTA